MRVRAPSNISTILTSSPGSVPRRRASALRCWLMSRSGILIKLDSLESTSSAVQNVAASQHALVLMQITCSVLMARGSDVEAVLQQRFVCP